MMFFAVRPVIIVAEFAGFMQAVVVALFARHILTVYGTLDSEWTIGSSGRHGKKNNQS